jgi:phosphoglycolate phosphatase
MQTLLFDFDGTLVDSINALVENLNAALGRFEYPHVEATELRRGLAYPFKNIFTKYVAEKHLGEITEFYFSLERARNTTEHFNLIAGADETLKYLTEKNLNLAVVTNKERALVENFLDEAGIKSFFGLIVGRDDVANPKPHAEPIEKALDFFQVEREEALLIGDSLTDIFSARAAQIECAAVLSGAGTEEIFAAENHRLVWRDVNAARELA